MSWLIAIDKILASALARYIILLVLAFCLGGNYQLNKLNAALEADIARYSQQVAVQEAFAEQAGKDMKKLQKKLDVALGEVKKKQVELEKRKREIINMPLTGDCENMVQQVVEELKR